MPDLEEAVNTLAKDLLSQNIAGLLMVFTPEAIAKAMAMQVQLQARAAELTAQGKTPAPARGYTIAIGDQQDEDQTALISLESADGTAEIRTLWRELDGLWKVTSLEMVAARTTDGTPFELPGSVPPAGPAGSRPTTQ